MDRKFQNRVLKDIVHGYIQITPIEKTIVEHRTFQRLRFVGQNSFAYYTYPNNHTNRFTHSLGVMHLGGRMFKKSIENASDDHLAEFLHDAKLYLPPRININSDLNEFCELWNENLGNISQISHPLLFRGSAEEQIQNIAVINVFWQSVRLACLLHDIGHFPFSHLMEKALKKSKAVVPGYGEFYNIEYDKMSSTYAKNIKDLQIQGKGQLDLHEMNGINLMSSAARPDVHESIYQIKPLANACSYLGRIIFVTTQGNYTHENDGIVKFLHTIVSSEIDVDRLDYSVRDPQSSASKLGAIDVDRLVNACRLYKTDGEYKIVLGATALSAIEEFYHQRFLTYKYIIYHHNVQRSDYAMIHIVKTLVTLYFSNKPDETTKAINKILEESGFIDPTNLDNPNRCMFLSKHPFYHYDDHWLRSVLLQVYAIFRPHGGKKNSQNEPSLNFTAFLEVVLFRKMKHVKSMWKRESDIIHDVRKIRKHIEDTGVDFADILNCDSDDLPAFNQQVEGLIIDTLNYLEANIALLNSIVGEFERDGITLIIASSPPKIFKEIEETPQVEILTRGGELISARNTSFYLNSLKGIATTTVIIRFYFFKKDFRHEFNDDRYKLLTSRLVELLAKKVASMIKSE